MSKLRLGILLSGRGSNFEAIARNVQNGVLDCEIGFVFSNKPAAPGLALARRVGLPCDALEMQGTDRAAYDTQVAALLKKNSVDFVCLAGYMRLLFRNFPSEY